MKIEIDKEARYQILAVNVRKEGVVIAIAPDEVRAYSGDMVELCSGKTGVVLVKEDYVEGSSLPEIEAVYGEELQKVTGIFRKYNFSWED